MQLTIGILSAIHSILLEDNLAICSLLSVVFFTFYNRDTDLSALRSDPEVKVVLQVFRVSFLVRL